MTIIPEIIQEGGQEGDGMIIRHRTKNGTEIFGMAVPNLYSGTGWDLGPTWAYLVKEAEATLIDTGRFGNGDILEQMLSTVGVPMGKIRRVIVTHSHEDHDGNLPEVLERTGAKLFAHPLYETMISYRPVDDADVPHPDFPVSCWFCPMPAEHSRTCAAYQAKRSRLKVDRFVGGTGDNGAGAWKFLHTPGHSADSISILFEDEVLFTGDCLLPGITPHPSLAIHFDRSRGVLPPEYAHRNGIFGLKSYIGSLRRIMGLSGPSVRAVFPAHRLFFRGGFNLIADPTVRAGEIISFHARRCGRILEIVAGGKQKAPEIAAEYFEPSLLKGAGGKYLAKKEILSHLELMAECGDLVWTDPHAGTARATGSRNFEGMMKLASSEPLACGSLACAAQR